MVVLEALAGTYNIHKLPPNKPIPSVLYSAALFCVLRSDKELSIVCDADITLTDAHADSQQVGPFVALRVAGTLDFALTGILSGLTTVLANADISVFSISSFDTDYLLVREDSRTQAHRSLQQAGYEIRAA